jgi:hypothetical protein
VPYRNIKTLRQRMAAAAKRIQDITPRRFDEVRSFLLRWDQNPFAPKTGPRESVPTCREIDSGQSPPRFFISMRMTGFQTR